MRALDPLLARLAVKRLGEAYTHVLGKHVSRRAFTVAFVVAESPRDNAVAFWVRLAWPVHGRDGGDWGI